MGCWRRSPVVCKPSRPHKPYICWCLHKSNPALHKSNPAPEALNASTNICMCGDGGRVVIRLHTEHENQCTGAYQLLTPYTHGVPHVDCAAPVLSVTRTNTNTSTAHAGVYAQLLGLLRPSQPESWASLSPKHVYNTHMWLHHLGHAPVCVTRLHRMAKNTHVKAAIQHQMPADPAGPAYACGDV
jgi:hypothetical protein